VYSNEFTHIIYGDDIVARINREQQETIRKKIKQVAYERFNDLGFEKTSTKEIAKAVGIAEGTLFNYFDSKTELFFEVFGDTYQNEIDSVGTQITLGRNVGEILMSHFQKVYGFFLKIPKGIMGELGIATIRMAKKHPERFKKLAQYDFDFLDELTYYTKRLVEAGIIEKVDERPFAEMIFSAIAYEMLMYIYDEQISKEQVYENTKHKIDILVKGYLRGEEQ